MTRFQKPNMTVTKTMSLRLGFWVTIAVLILFLPASGSVQMAYDPTFVTTHRLTDPIPRERIVTGTYKEFMVPVDIQGSRVPTRTLGFLLGTNGRLNHCTVHLRLLKTDAEPVPCEDLVDNSYQIFHFPIVIGDAEYPAKLWVEGGDEEDGVSPYLLQGKYTGIYWALPEREVEAANVIAPLNSWYDATPGRACAYFGILALALLIAATRVTWRLSALAGVLYLGNAVIAPYFAGHDETAHLTMFRYAYIEATVDDPAVSPPLLDHAFNERTTALMYESRFFRAHNVSLADPAGCPHMILGSCGVTDGPEVYYFALSKILHALKINLVQPEDFLLTARIVNLVTYAAVVLLLLLIMGREGVRGGMWCLLAGGSMLAEVASVSNDNFMFAVGLIGGGAMYAAISPKIPVWRALTLLVLYTVVDLLCRAVDDSSYAALPVIVSIAAFLLVRAFDRTDTGNKRPLKSGTIAALATCILTVCVVFVAGRTIPDIISAPIEAFSVRAAWLIRLIPKPAGHMILRALHYNMTATFGSFVWGHSTVWPPLLGILSAGLVGLSLCALRVPRWQQTKSALASGIALGILVAGHILMLISVLSYFTRPGTLLTAAVMPRFFGTDFAPLLALSGCGFYYLKDRNSRVAGWIERGIILWILLLLFHFLPRFYVADFL